MGDEEKKMVVFELNAEKWKAMTPTERLRHVNLMHKQMLEAMTEEDSSNEEEE